jgi:adenosylhomocysteine nucleosidase
VNRSLFLPAALALAAALAAAAEPRFAVIVSADAEWKAVRPLFPEARMARSPYGEYFFAETGDENVLFFQGGWGKVSAAASAQYLIDRFHPAFLINLGTCGGVEGRIRRFAIVAPERVVIYDIHEAMGDSREATEHYTTVLEVPARTPVPVVRTTLYSADSDLTPAGLKELERRYRAVAVDWESGAIAWVAKRNTTPLLILRGVTDLVSPAKAEAEGNLALFQTNAARIMKQLVADLPRWFPALRTNRPPAAGAAAKPAQ